MYQAKIQIAGNSYPFDIYDLPTDDENEILKYLKDTLNLSYDDSGNTFGTITALYDIKEQ